MANHKTQSNPYDIITIGSASIDIWVKSHYEVAHVKNHLDIGFRKGAKILADKFQITTGGGGTNTAVAFSRLGLKTGYIGSIGNDTAGKIILDDLKKEKVDFLGSIKKMSSGHSVVLAGVGDRTILAFKGANNMLSFSDIPKNLNSKWIYAGTMVGKSFNTELKFLKLMKSKGSKIALNPSSYLTSKGLNKLNSLLSIIDILILNKEEAELLTREKKLSKIFSKLSRFNFQAVVITNGSKPVFAQNDLKIYNQGVGNIHPVDTTGAGDAFGAGFLYGIMKGNSMKRSLYFGCKEAHSVLRHIGAKNNLLRKL